MRLTTGGLIPKLTNFTKTYIMYTKCLHGGDREDATTSTHQIRFDHNEEKKVIAYFDFFVAFINKDMSNAKELTEFAISHANTLELDATGDELVTRVIPPDNKYLGMLSTLTGLAITYVDDDGHEHYVTVAQK